MKKLLVLPVVLLMGAAFATAHRPSSAIPGAVTSAFEKQYPNASVKKWAELKNDYTVKFKLRDAKYVAVFQPDGSWEKTERKFALTGELPAPVKQGFRHSGYEGCNIDGIKEVETPRGEIYVIRVDDGDYYDSNHHDGATRDFELTFSTDGHLIQAARASFRDSGGL